MSWRTVIISSRCKLDAKLGYMVVRGEEVHRIFMDEIALLMIENPAVSMTGCLLSELMDRKIKVIFCDDKRTPQGELIPYYGCHDTSRKIRMQIAWSDLAKGMVWGRIIARKIRCQAELLWEFHHETEADMLLTYEGQLEFQDSTNRERHAAKVYFNALFGKDFSREADSPVNAALNYGYGLLLSAFNREIAANGYLTQLGLHHGNVFNRFNLSSDLMEPFRVLVDRTVCYAKPEAFDKEMKHSLINLLHMEICIGGSKQTVLNGISIYVRSVFDALCKEDAELIRFWQDEL